MSTGTRMRWAQAAELARDLVAELRFVAQRAKTVGSVRRCRPEVSDLEILVEPRTISSGLFGELVPDLEAIRSVASTWGDLVKNGDRFIQVRRPDGVTVDLFLCHPPAQWGSLLAIRTGPADLGQHAVTRMRSRGVHHEGGRVIDDRSGEVIPTPEEEDFFRLAGLPCLPPRLRDTPAALRSVPQEARHG